MRNALTTMLTANAAANVDRITRRILDELDAQARKFLRLLDQAEKDRRDGVRGSRIMLSIHGDEPAIRDIVRRAKWHREHGKVKAAA